MIRASELNTLQYDPGACIGCGMCIDVCPHGVFALNGRVAQFAHPEVCMECGACQLNCSTGAIAVDSGVGCAAAMIRDALRMNRLPPRGRSAAPQQCGEKGGATRDQPFAEG